MIGTLESAASGINSGLARLDYSAAATAHAPTPNTPSFPDTASHASGDLTTHIIESIIARHSVSANAAMFRQLDSAIGELIDLIG